MPIKYVRWRGTWVHIASDKPFEIKPGQYGRYSSTICGKEYEMDDEVIRNEAYAKEHLCKVCAARLRKMEAKEKRQ